MNASQFKTVCERCGVWDNDLETCRLCAHSERVDAERPQVEAAPALKLAPVAPRVEAKPAWSPPARVEGQCVTCGVALEGFLGRRLSARKYCLGCSALASMEKNRQFWARDREKKLAAPVHAGPLSPGHTRCSMCGHGFLRLMTHFNHCPKAPRR